MPVHTCMCIYGLVLPSSSPLSSPQRAPRKPQPTSPIATTVRLPDKPTDSLKTINRSVNVNTHSPALAYDKDINPYAKMAAASALDAAGERGKYKYYAITLVNPIL